LCARTTIITTIYKNQDFGGKDLVKFFFEKWAKSGHFSRTLAKGPNTTTWIWNLQVDGNNGLFADSF
jgi:hypothetical protein